MNTKTIYTKSHILLIDTEAERTGLCLNTDNSIGLAESLNSFKIVASYPELPNIYLLPMPNVTQQMQFKPNYTENYIRYGGLLAVNEIGSKGNQTMVIKKLYTTIENGKEVLSGDWV
jgi:hypothetical protein